MPSRKQRRRREKNFRHEYETVLLDEDGNAVPLDPEELRAEREERERSRPKPARDASGKKQPRGRTPRPVRAVAPPSWNRAFKRGGTMGSIMLVAFLFLFKSAPIGVRLAWGIFYAIAFVPLTFWIDRFAYRSYLKRSGTAEPKSPKTS